MFFYKSIEISIKLFKVLNLFFSVIPIITLFYFQLLVGGTMMIFAIKSCISLVIQKLIIFLNNYWSFDTSRAFSSYKKTCIMCFLSYENMYTKTMFSCCYKDTPGFFFLWFHKELYNCLCYDQFHLFSFIY